MAVPRNRHSNARKNSRRAHMAKKPANVRNCPTCSKPTLPHRVCLFCGHYANKLIVEKETSE